ncbi:hypothetical protein CHUAL_014059 [Chamberlinius hualienensis]
MERMIVFYIDSYGKNCFV